MLSYVLQVVFFIEDCDSIKWGYSHGNTLKYAEKYESYQIPSKSCEKLTNMCVSFRCSIHMVFILFIGNFSIRLAFKKVTRP